MVTNINANERRVLSDLKAIAGTLNLPMILVGAGARLLIFDRIFGEGRRTKDLDIAVSIESWETYQQLGNTLIGGDPPLFQKTNVPHRFKHIETNIDIDIVPFGKIGEPDQKIEWSDTDNVMNVAGFSEALSHATIERLDDLEIRVITLPSFVFLKIFAWGDRAGGRINKDVEDLDFVLSKYSEDDERVFDELSEELENEEIKYLDASIYLLGRDISRMLQLKTFLELNQVLEKLIRKLGDDEPGSLGYRLNILQRGINSRSPDPGS